MIKASVYSQGAAIWVSSTSFQKSDIGWPHQPPIEKFKKIFWKKEFECTKCKATFNFFFQHFWLFYAFLVRMTACTLHIKWFPWHQEPLQPHWPQQPRKPHWPHQPHQAYFLQEIPDHDGLIIPGTKMTNTGPFLWNRSSKIQFFTDIWYLFCWRLLRSGYVTFLKTGWWNSNGRTSERYRCLHHNQKVVFRWSPRSSK